MARFYTYPLNYGTGRTSPVEAGDNRYDTATNSASVVCNIDTLGTGLGTARDLTTIFVKCKGVASWASTIDSTNITKTLQDTVTNDSNETVSTIIDGFQHDLTDIPWNTRKPRDTSITFTFTAKASETISIAEIMVLDEIERFEYVEAFSRFEIDWIDLSTVYTGATGRVSKIPALNNERDKWLANLTLYGRGDIQQNRESIDKMRLFIRKYKNFACAVEPNRYPDLIAPCIFPNAESQMRYLTRTKKTGRTLSFTVREA